LQGDLIPALAKDFEAHGEGAIRIVGPLTRQRISRLLCSVLPKESVFENALADLNDDKSF
jgi:hypothetical protein